MVHDYNRELYVFLGGRWGLEFGWRLVKFVLAIEREVNL